jgi:hypothetical protein
VSTKKNEAISKCNGCREEYNRRYRQEHLEYMKKKNVGIE